MPHEVVLRRSRGDCAPGESNEELVHLGDAAEVSGDEHYLFCPWCGHHKPKLAVNPERGCFLCFVCEAKGAVFEPTRTLGSLGPRAHQESTMSWTEDQLEEREEALDWALQWFVQRLHGQAVEGNVLTYPDAGPAASYLRGRGFSLQAVRAFSCGYCPAIGYGDSRFRWRKGVLWEFSEAALPGFEGAQEEFQQLRDWGLLGWEQVTAQWTPYLRMRGRLVFPLTAHGRTTNLAGRAVTGLGLWDELRQDGGGSTAWLFLRNPPGVPKGVFNEPALEADQVALCEGVFDALAAEAMGQPALALMGKSLPGWLLPRLRGKVVVLALDQDSPGHAAALKILRKLRGVARRVLQPARLPPDCKDMSEFYVSRIVK